MEDQSTRLIQQRSSELTHLLEALLTKTSDIIAQSEDQIPPKALKELQSVLTDGRRLSTLLDSLLHFPKSGANEIKLVRNPISISGSIDAVVTYFKNEPQEKSLQFVNRVGSSFPKVIADKKRLEQILLNLIKVIIACTRNGFIEVSARTGKDDITLIISATGLILAEEFEHINRTSEQPDDLIIDRDSEDVFHYTIARQLIELHEAKLHVNIIPGNALKFSFGLPVAKEAATPAYIAPVVEDVALPAPVIDQEKRYRREIELSKTQFKLLIIDDEPTVCQFLLQYLTLMDYVVHVANSGMEALGILNNGFRPDLVLLDIMMPEMDGFEVCTRIRQKYPRNEVPVILLTARDNISDIIKGFDAGANDYVTKPFSNNVLGARIKTHLQLANISAAYSRFVPQEFLRLLGHDSIVNVKLGEQVHREMTIFFSDIRSFTTLSENMTPQENFEFLNSYLSRVSPVIWKNHGFIDKYIGDAMMALFPDEAGDALRGAIEVVEEIKLYNEHRAKSHYKPIKVGIGLHTGAVILGTIGYSRYMQGTVISDAVNLASRIENLTKLYGASILISEQTLFHLRDAENHQYRFLDLIRVKGKKHSISVFEIFDGDEVPMVELKQETRADFEQGVYLYHSKKFVEAHELFKNVTAANEHDSAAQLYVSRCEKFIYGGMPEGWDGVATMDEKL